MSANVVWKGLSRGDRYANLGRMASRRPLNLVFAESRSAVGMTQAELADAIGSSQRTIGRVEAGKALLSPSNLTLLAKRLHPAHRELAAEVLAHGGLTLESAGLESPTPVAASSPVAPVAPPPPPAAPARSQPEHLIGGVVLAAMLASGATVDVVRRCLHAAAKQACDAGLTMSELERVLRPEPDAPADTPT